MKKLFANLAVLLAFTACQIEEVHSDMQDSTSKGDVEYTIYEIHMESDADTKTHLDDNGTTVLWSEGDKMNIFFGNNNEAKDFLSLVPGNGGSTIGQFEGPYFSSTEGSDITDLHQTVVVYPYDENNTCVANDAKTQYTIGLTVPTVQKYAENSFANGCFPMIGVSEFPRNVILETKNVLSGLEIQLKGNKTISKVVVVSEDEALSGPASVLAAYGENPVITVTEETAQNYVELDCGDGVQLNDEVATAFYLAFAPFTGPVSIYICDTEGGFMVLDVESEKVFTRNIFKQLPLDYTPLSILEQLKYTLLNGGEFRLPIDLTVNEMLDTGKGTTAYIDLGGNTLTTTYIPSGSSGAININGSRLIIQNGKIVAKGKNNLFTTSSFKNGKLYFGLTDVDIVKTTASGTVLNYPSDGVNAYFTNVNVNTKSFVFTTTNGSQCLGEIVINGGKYTSGDGKYVFNIPSRQSVQFEGTPLFSDKSYTRVAWYEAGDGYYTPGGVIGAVVGDLSFVNIQEAIQHAISAGEEEIKLVEDVELDEPIIIGESLLTRSAGSASGLTLNLNGKTLTYNQDTEDWSAAVIVYSGDITIMNGTIATNGTNAHKKMGAVWVRGTEDASVTIENGTFKGNNWSVTPAYGQTDDSMATIYVSNPNGFVTINGGKFFCVQQPQVAGQNQILNYKNSFETKNIVVYGGTFYGMNPAIGNGSEVSYVADGYSVEEIGADVFEVKKSILTAEDLKTAIADGGNIALSADITLSETIVINNDVVINLNGKTLTNNKTSGRAFDIAADNVNLTVNAEGAKINFGSETYGFIRLMAGVDGANVTINGGTFKGTSNTGTLVRFTNGSNNIVTINGVTYQDDDDSHTGENAGNAWVVWSPKVTGTGNKLYVNGGTFSSVCGFGGPFYSEFNNASITAKLLALELKSVTTSENEDDFTIVENGNHIVKDCIVTLAPGGNIGRTPGTCVSASFGSAVMVQNCTLNAPTDGTYALAVFSSGGAIKVDASTQIEGSLFRSGEGITIEE